MLRRLRLLFIAVALALGVIGVSGVSVASAQGTTVFQFVREVAKAAIAATVKATKLTEAEILLEVLSGKTLAQIIQEKSADLTVVKADAKTTLTAAIKDAVSKGTLTQVEADNLTARVDNALNQAFDRGRGGLANALRSGAGGARVMVDVVRRALQEIATATKLTQAEVVRELASGKTPAALITEKGARVEDVARAIKDDATKAIKDAVTSGRITQAQADALLASLDERITQALNNPLQLPGRAGQGQNNPAARLIEVSSVSVLIAETAKQTNLTQREVLAQLRTGKTLTEIATANKADPAKIIEAAQTALNTRIDALVTANRLTADQAAQIKTTLATSLKTAMDSKTLLQFGIGRRR